MILMEVVDELGDDLRVGLALEAIVLLDEERPDLLVVGDDAVVYHHEGVVRVGPLGMGVVLAGAAVRRPAGVRDAAVGGGHVVDVQLGFFAKNFILKHLD